MGLKIGLIGCGGMGTTHNLSLKALAGKMDIEVTAIADCRPECRDKALLEWPQAKAYETGMELIEQENLDLVHICLPSDLHASHAAAAMEKGMHVFVEKPVCLTQEDCSRLKEVQKRTGVKVMVGQVVRCFEEYRYLKEVYDGKTLGRLKSILMQRAGGSPKWGYEGWFYDEKRSGAVVLDLHVHDLDFLRYMMGEPLSYDVKASAFESGLVNQVVVSYQFPTAFAMAEATWDESPSLPFEAAYRAFFEEGTVVYRGSSDPKVTVYHKDGSITLPELHAEYEAEDTSNGINISSMGPYYTEIKYFLECILEDKEVTLAPLAEAVKSVQLGAKILDAAKTYITKHAE